LATARIRNYYTYKRLVVLLNCHVRRPLIRAFSMSGWRQYILIEEMYEEVLSKNVGLGFLLLLVGGSQSYANCRHGARVFLVMNE
jgi:hypothetical protein